MSFLLIFLFTIMIVFSLLWLVVSFLFKYITAIFPEELLDFIFSSLSGILINLKLVKAGTNKVAIVAMVLNPIYPILVIVASIIGLSYV